MNHFFIFQVELESLNTATDNINTIEIELEVSTHRDPYFKNLLKLSYPQKGSNINIQNFTK